MSEFVSLIQLLVVYFGCRYCRLREINQSSAHYTHVDVLPNQGYADKHCSPWTVSHRDYRVPNLPMVQAVSVDGVPHALLTDGSHGNDLSSAPYQGSLIHINGGWHDGLMTSVRLLGWNQGIGPRTSMFQVGRRCPSGLVLTLQCLQPSPWDWHSLLCRATGTASSAQGS